MEASQWIGLKDYAATLGVTPEAVLYAIKTGRIPDECIQRVKGKGRGGINVLINKADADVAWVQTHNEGHNRNSNAKEAVKNLEKDIASMSASMSSIGTQDKPSTSLSDAQRHEKIAKAGIARLEFERLKGSLVRKDVVYKQLFEAGTMLRDSIMAVPDRVSAEIAAYGGNQAKIRTLLVEALASAMESLGDIYEKKFGD